jgi:hypothetical protein
MVEMALSDLGLHEAHVSFECFWDCMKLLFLLFDSSVVFECIWDCMMLLSLLFYSSVVLSLCPFLGTESFYMELSWSFLISIFFTWLLGTWVRIYVLPSNLLCWALVLVNAFIKGEIVNKWWRCAHVCVMNDWHVWKVWGFFCWVIFYMCLIMLMANRRCYFELCCVKCVVQHVSWLVVRRCGARR